MKVLNKKEIEELLFSNWGYYLYYDAIENKVYICNYDYEKIGRIRFSTFLKINMNKFILVNSCGFSGYYQYCYELPKDTIYKY